MPLSLLQDDSPLVLCTSPRKGGSETFTFGPHGEFPYDEQAAIRQLHLRNSKPSLTQRFKDKIRRSVKRIGGSRRGKEEGQEPGANEDADMAAEEWILVELEQQR